LTKKKYFRGLISKTSEDQSDSNVAAGDTVTILLTTALQSGDKIKIDVSFFAGFDFFFEILRIFSAVGVETVPRPTDANSPDGHRTTRRMCVAVDRRNREAITDCKSVRCATFQFRKILMFHRILPYTDWLQIILDEHESYLTSVSVWKAMLVNPVSTQLPHLRVRLCSLDEYIQSRLRYESELHALKLHATRLEAYVKGVARTDEDDDVPNCEIDLRTPTAAVDKGWYWIFLNL